MESKQYFSFSLNKESGESTVREDIVCYVPLVQKFGI